MGWNKVAFVALPVGRAIVKPAFNSGGVASAVVAVGCVCPILDQSTASAYRVSADGDSVPSWARQIGGVGCSAAPPAVVAFEAALSLK